MDSKKFNLQNTINNMEGAYNYLQANKDVPFVEIENTLHEICKLFKEINTFLGIAFNDVQSKVSIINGNRAMYPQIKGFMEFIGKEMQQGIHKFNGENNDKLGAPPNFKKYVSTARSLLRMMWLMTFIKTFFNDSITTNSTKLAPMLDHAYDDAFGEKHSWIVRNGAKLAIKAAPNKDYLMEVFLGKKDEALFTKTVQRLLGYLNPIWEALWAFYRANNLVDLE